MGNELAFFGFMELSSDRQIGFGAGQIPWSSLNAWCREHGIQGEQRELVLDMIKGMDLVYLRYVGEKNKTKE